MATKIIADTEQLDPQASQPKPIHHQSSDVQFDYDPAAISCIMQYTNHQIKF